MNKLLSKFLFAQKITAGLPSLARLLWNSKLLRWSKTGFVKASSASLPACFRMRYQHGRRNLFLRTYDGDIDIFYEIFWKKIYDLPGLKIDPVKTIVDAGANVGLSALYFLAKYPNAKIICIEPEYSNFKVLSQNLAEEIHTGKVQALEMALMGEDGQVSFKAAAAKYNSKVAAGISEKNIGAVSMGTLMKEHSIEHIDILKIDVEGAEKYIFSGHTGWLEQVDHILLETHSPEDYTVCMNAFKKYDFMVEPLLADVSNENLFWARRKIS